MTSRNESKAVPRRAKFRKGLSNLYLPLYDALCAELPEEWQPYQGLRSFMEQEALYMQGRILPGKIVTNAHGGESPHNYGAASDWTLWEDGEPIWMRIGDKRWYIYRDAIEKVGLFWGGSFNDDYHNELAIKCRWPEVKARYMVGGMDAAQSFIQSQLEQR